MQQFQSIHYLRAVAAMMIVAMHSHTGADFMQHHIKETAWLRGGVDIFFVISGFVMAQSTGDKTVSPRQFLIRRCQRIIPLYWLATLMMIPLLHDEYLFILGSMLFIPMAHPGNGLMQPVVEPGWTLNYEMFFYLLFGLSLAIWEKWRFWAVSALLLALAAAPLVVPVTGMIGFYTKPIILEFLFGMAIARYNLRGPAWLIPIGFCLMYLLYPLGHDRLVALGLPAALIVIGAVGSEANIRPYRVPNLIGDASYSIYIFHLPALRIIIDQWPRLGFDTAFFVPAAMVFVLAVAVPMHWVVEKPIIASFRRYNAQSPTRSANTADSTRKRQTSRAAFKIE